MVVLTVQLARRRSDCHRHVAQRDDVAGVDRNRLLAARCADAHLDWSSEVVCISAQPGAPSDNGLGVRVECDVDRVAAGSCRARYPAAWPAAVRNADALELSDPLQAIDIKPVVRQGDALVVRAILLVLDCQSERDAIAFDPPLRTPWTPFSICRLCLQGERVLRCARRPDR